MSTKGGPLPHWLQRIQQHNDQYNKRLLVGQLVRIFLHLYLRKHAP